MARGTACCGEGGALADACIKTDATRSTVAVGYPLATNQRNQNTQKNDPQKRVVLVGLPGFEPRMTGPESVVLPLHHSPIFVFDDAKVEHIF